MRGMSCNQRYPLNAPYIDLEKERLKVTSLKRRITSFIIVITIINSMLIISFFQFSQTKATGIESRVEPIVILGSDLPNFIGKPIDELWVYSHTGSAWEQIPHQIDERNDVNGSYFYNSVDGILDANDELVFMPMDCGEMAPAASRVPNTEPQRYRIRAQDPLDASVKYAYIYTSSVITKTFTQDYADYEPISRKIEADDYTIGFNETSIGVIDELRIATSAGGDDTDILDRFKYRFQKTPIITPDQYHEGDFTGDMIGIIDGPIRVISQFSKEKITGDFTLMVNDTYYAYKSYLNVISQMSTNTTTDWVEITIDLMSSSAPLTYFDSNSNELTIDGTPESPGSTTTPLWTEATGAAGTIISVGNFSELGLTTSLIYTDDSTSLDDPESDSGEYGNYGISSTNPPMNSTIYFSFYFASSSQGNIGSTYLNYTDNPVTISVLSQIIDPSPPPQISDITSEPDPQEINGLVKISAEITDNLDEVKSVHVRIIDPNNNIVGNFSMDYDAGADRYYYENSYATIGTYNFMIWASDNNGNWDSDSGQFVLWDTKSPEISDINFLPAQVGVEESLNISGSITDVEVISGVWINIQDPNSAFVGNFSMVQNPTNSEYFLVGTYDIVGIYSFTVYTNDSSNNWNSSQGQFEILDTVNPVADAGSHQDTNDGTIVEFDASGSSDNVGIVNYTWTLTDIIEITLYGEKPTYRFLNTGNFKVDLKVTDAQMNFDTHSIWVNVTEIITHGSISGIVTNSDGNPIAGAKVTIENISYETTTDGTGNYLIQDIPAGIYDIIITRDGYKTETINDVVVVATQTTSDVFVTMDKKQSTSQEENGGFIWLILIVIVIALLLIAYLLARPKRETEIVEEVIEELHFLCPECGTLVNYDMKSCPGCGVEFGEGEVEEPKEEEPVKESEADIYMCPSCGSFVSSSATECEKCGYDFQEEEEPQEKDKEISGIPPGFVKGPNSESEEDENSEDKSKETSIPADIKAKMAKEVETLLSENGFEMEEVEMELEVELGEDGEGGENSIGAKEILELFKEELKDDDIHEDSKSDYHAMSKEIDDILDDKEDNKTKENKKDNEKEDD
jgi:hypothetical protein